MKRDIQKLVAEPDKEVSSDEMICDEQCVETEVSLLD